MDNDKTLILRNVPDSLRKALKIRAAELSTTMRAIILQAAEEWLEKHKEIKK